MEKREVAIIGAGPAGSTLAHFLAKADIDHVLLDKSSFPRDKICGDGITVDVLNVLKRISPDLEETFTRESEVTPSWGICIHAANGRELRYDFSEENFKYAPIYTARRLKLDNFLIEKLNGKSDVRLQTEVVGLERSAGGFVVSTRSAKGESQFFAKYLIGAEGEKPIVTRHLNLPHFREKHHLAAGLRVYYKNVKGFHPGNHLELFFDKKAMPGYFWAFPLGNGEANVGLGMLSAHIANKRVNLKKLLTYYLEEHPRISSMFAEAEALEKPQGWGLPFITPKRQIAGAGYALIGDAGGIIEPVTGKGIGPGMMSARICSEVLIDAIQRKQHDLSPYNERMYRYYRREIRIGYTLQKSLKYPVVVNGLIDLGNVAPLKYWAQRRLAKSWGEWM